MRNKQGGPFNCPVYISKYSGLFVKRTQMEPSPPWGEQKEQRDQGSLFSEDRALEM